MNNTNSLVFHVMQELRKAPRPTCLPCLGITSPGEWGPVQTHIASQYHQLYKFEDGICWKCQTKQELIHRLQLHSKQKAFG